MYVSTDILSQGIIRVTMTAAMLKKFYEEYKHYLEAFMFKPGLLSQFLFIKCVYLTVSVCPPLKPLISVCESYIALNG